MRLMDVAWSNLRRRRSKVLLLVLGLAVGVMTVVALQAITATLRADMEVKLDEYGANILVVPRSRALSLSYGGLTVAAATYDVGELTTSDVALIPTIPYSRNISIIAPKLLSAVEIRGHTVLMAGVDFPAELRLKKWWRLIGREPETEGEAIVGARLASLLDLNTGSSVQVGNETFRIVAVLAENGTQDDDILFVALPAAQRALNRPGAVTLVEVAALCTACPIEELVKEIEAVLPQARVVALRQAVTLRMETVEQLGRFSVLVSSVVLGISGLVVMTTMLGAVAERKPEIGLLRAVGFRRTHIARIILTEAGILSGLGGLLGWLMGMAAAMLLTPTVAQATVSVQWNPWLAIGAVGLALVVGLLAGLYPAIQAARLDPTTALRSL